MAQCFLVYFFNTRANPYFTTAFTFVVVGNVYHSAV